MVPLVQETKHVSSTLRFEKECEACRVDAGALLSVLLVPERTHTHTLELCLRWSYCRRHQNRPPVWALARGVTVLGSSKVALSDAYCVAHW